MHHDINGQLGLALLPLLLLLLPAASTDCRLRATARSDSQLRCCLTLVPHPSSRTPLHTQVLAVVAAFVAYAWAVDSLWSLIPRFIRWSHAHPGWPGRAAAAALAAARQRLTGAA